MKHWRNIIIRNEKYRWCYFYDDLDFSNYPFSYLIISPCSDRKKEIRIIFHKLPSPVLLSGFKGALATLDGEEVYINLNEPQYIRALMEYLLDKTVDFHLQDKYIFKNGEYLLEELGYIFEM